jgi:HemY protein
MKRGLLLLLVLLSLGAVLGFTLLHDPGYAMVSWRRTSVEMSLGVAALFWCLSLLIAVVFIDVLSSLLGVSHWWARWTRNRNLLQSARVFQEGSAALEQGDWKRAERLLFTAAKLSTEPLPAYLAAARAAAHGHAVDRAEQYLVLAEEKGNRLAVGQARTRLLLSAGHWEQAIVLLAHLQDKYPRDESLLMLRIDALTRLQRWNELAELLPTLQQRAHADGTKFQALEKHANREVLRWMGLAGSRVDRSYTAKKLRQYWESLPKRLRHDEELTATYASELIKTGADNDAEALLADTLSRQWSNAAIEVYGRTRSTHPDAALRRAEAWKEKHPHNPALMLALGRLSLQMRRWPEARHYFEAALALQASPEAYAELIRLLTRLNEGEVHRHELNRYIVESLGAVSARLPDLPLP